MAYERNTTEKIVKGDSLDAFVSNLSKSFATQMAVRNAEEEVKFNEAIVEQGLSLEDQLEFRKGQLSNVADDPAEKKRIRAEIATLKQLVTQKKFSDDYVQKLSDFQSGLSSVDSVINWLEGQKTTATDQAVLNKINEQLAQKKSEKFTMTKQLLENQTKYAVDDKTDSILSEQIGRVNTAKNKALLSGDDTLVSMYDLQLQSLNKAKTENGIVKDITTMATTSATGYSGAVSLLDSYNSKISSSASTGSITVGGVTYGSSKEFWTFKRDSYLSDSSNQGFFGRLNDETNTKIKVSDSKNNLTVNTLGDTTRVFDNLQGRPELAGYQERLTTAKQDSLQTGANLLSDRITNRFAVDYDLNKAVGEINGLKNLGVKVDDAYTKILTAAGQIKQSQVNNILQAVSTALQSNPNMTTEEAFATAIGSGAGTVLSPQDLATKSEKDLGKSFTDTATKGTGTVDPRLTVTDPKPNPADPAGAATPQTPAPGAQPQPQPTVTAPATPAPAPVAPVAPKFKTITIKSGDTLSGIALRELGSATRFKEIADLNKIADPNKIQAGGNLMIPI